MTGIILYFPLALGTLYVIAGALNRLYFSPISKFPGPPLAAITTAYEMYFDLIVSGGMLRQLQKLHKIYGPVVRIGPNQLHFSDPSAYFDIYGQRSTVSKDPRLYDAFGLKDSIVTMTDQAKARTRRDMVHPFFSRRAILELEDVIQKKVNKMIFRLQEASLSAKPIDLHLAFRSATHDIISSYCFSECFDILDAPGFDHPIMTAVIEQLPAVWILKHFHWLLKLPSTLVSWNSGFKALAHIRNTLNKQIDLYIEDQSRLSSAEHEIIYHHLMTPQDKQSHRFEALGRDALVDDAIAFISAGSDTVGQTTTAAIFYSLSNPIIYSRLSKKITQAWPSKDQNVHLTDLEKLPYLTAVIKEAMRISTGVVTPLPRVVNAYNMTIGNYVVAKGTVVAMGHTFLHENAEIFPDPHIFNPDRWLERKNLDTYLVPFSRGPRMCLATNLAWAELYMLIANTVRHLELKIHNTTPADMQDFRELFAPLYKSHFHAIVSSRMD